MPQEFTEVVNPVPRAGSVVLVPGERFFVRRVPLAPEGDVGTQVELALEGLSPFPAGQLYYGFRTDSGRTQALVFAAYRKNFTPEETASWTGAAAVLPDFSVWLGPGSPPPAGVWVREHGGRVEAVAWDGRSQLAAALLVRAAGATDRAGLVNEARRKAGLPVEASVKMIKSSALETTREKGELIIRLAGGDVETRFDATALGQADIRDKLLLAERRQTLRRDRLLWHGFVAMLGGLAACVALELGVLATRSWLRVQLTEIKTQADTVTKIDLAQSLAKRLEEISEQRLRPFEMLAEVNDKRPKSVEFSRVVTSGLWRMDIEAQTSNASDLRDFEADVRKLAAIDHVEVRDPRTREGLTTFMMEVTFKPGWLKAGGGT